MNVSWREGAPDCEKASEPPLQIHQYNNQTFIIRESLCSTFEAPFVFLLIGSNRAMLIDTGDVADPAKMPLAKTVSQLIQTGGGPDKPLLVVHTHRHLDHRAGDAQFQGLPNTQVVGFDLDSVRRFYRFTEWPEGVAQIDLGDRIVDALSTPGHNETEVSFYDRNTALFFSGDFLIPGHLLIDDAQSDLASAVAQLTTMKGDLDSHSTLIARNRDELEVLKHKGDRNYYEFTLAKGQKKPVGTVSLELKKADPKKSRFTLAVFADDKQYDKKDRYVNEPLQFYAGKDPALYEIVVNNVGSKIG